MNLGKHVRLIQSTIALTVALSVLALAAPANAVSSPSTTPELLAKATSDLANLEQIMTRVESQKLYTMPDDAALSKTMYDYAQTMHSALDRALAEAKLASSTKGSQGNVDWLHQFEVSSVDQIKRYDRFYIRYQRVGEQIQHGAIRTAYVGAPDPAGAIVTWLKSQLGTPIVQPADAALGIPAYVACAAASTTQAWVLCAAAIASAIQPAIDAWNKFQNCWNHPQGRWNWQKNLYKAWCVAVFLGTLA